MSLENETKLRYKIHDSSLNIVCILLFLNVQCRKKEKRKKRKCSRFRDSPRLKPYFALLGETSLLLLYFIGDFVEVSRGKIGPSIEKYTADAVDTGVLILSKVLRDERDRKLRGRGGRCIGTERERHYKLGEKLTELSPRNFPDTRHAITSTLIYDKNTGRVIPVFKVRIGRTFAN